jgi:hypothetical protein
VKKRTVTLNITLLTPTAIYQSADFRLTNPSDGSLIRDESAKTVVLRYTFWSGFVTYTGLGSWEGENLSDLVAGWLTGIHGATMADVAAIVEREGTRLIREPRRRNGTLFPHTFVLAGFEGQAARAFVISNFEDSFGRTRLATDDHLTSTSRELRAGRTAVAIVTGRPKAISTADKRILCRLALKNPLDGGLIRRKMQKLNASASTAVASGGAVSRDCAVISFRFDGYGKLQMSETPGAEPKKIPVIFEGVDTNKFAAEALANIGLDMSNAQLGATTYVSTYSPGPSGSLQSSCTFPIRDNSASGRYEIREISAKDFDTTFADDINYAGHAVGDGREKLKGATTKQIPWVMRDGVVRALNYEGSAWAINRDGLIAAMVQGGSGYQAAIYVNDSLRVFPLDGADVAAVGATLSTANQINDAGTIAGSVCTQTGHNIRAAAFRDSHPPVVLTDVVSQYGVHTVGINDHGQVLVHDNVGPSDVRSIVWNINDNSWAYVGNSAANVSPIAITNDGLVLGVSADGTSLAMICEPQSEWRALGTSEGWSPRGINDSGDVIGNVTSDGLIQPWVRLAATGQVFVLPSVIGHDTDARAINNAGVIAGSAHADHGGHAVIWCRR